MNEQTVLRHDDVSLQYLAVDLDELNGRLEHMAAEDRVAWGLEHFGERIVLSSSFGAQAAVSLHMVTRQRPDIPVVLIDTGHLFPETYQFVEQLSEQLSLNLHVFRPKFSSHWQEQRFGRLWEQGIDGIEVYNRINKVEPMNRALRELAAQAWFSGIRRDQSSTRAGMRYVMARNRRMKVHSILDWSDRDVYRYLTHHHLPYHPLWHQGYVSIGDVHTTSKLGDGMSEADTRFFGLKRECGIHEDV